MKNKVIHVDFSVKQAWVEPRRNSEVLLSKERVVAVYCEGRAFVVGDYAKSEWRHIRRFLQDHELDPNGTQVSYNPLEFMIAVIEASQ